MVTVVENLTEKQNKRMYKFLKTCIVLHYVLLVLHNFVLVQ